MTAATSPPTGTTMVATTTATAPGGFRTVTPVIPRPRRHASLDPGIRRDLRRIITLVALTPLLFVLANETPRLLDDPLTTAYGALVLAVTIALMYIAYAHYEDPSVQELAHRPRDVASLPPLPDQPRVSMLL